MSHHAHEPSLATTIRHILRKPKTTLALLGMPGIALAGPTGEVVVGGEAVITRPNSVTTHIDQLTQRAAINWWTFDVAADEYVIFDQPDASAIVLNRVIGGDPSQIFGQILANGQVFLLNPQGVFFAPGATVDVQGLLASSLDMNPDDFMTGDFSLTRAENASANGNVINNGSITAGSGGYVLLAGDFVDNTGIISANAGTIALVSGNALTLDIEGDGLVNFAVNEATLSDIAGVRNAGSLIADGGRIIMTAQVANNLMSTVVNNEGLVRAQSIEEHGGEIYLVGYGGNVVNSGTLDTDGVNADGGRIIVYGDQDVTLADGGVQTAAGDANHNGGFMRFIAEDHLDYQADNLIRATGGVSGGFVEVSGHGSITLLGAPQIGAGGQLIIDPASVEIQIGTASTLPSNTTGGPTSRVTTGWLESQLTSSVDVTLVASSAITYTGTTSAAINATGPGNLLIAIGSIALGDESGASSQDTSFGGNRGVWLNGPPTVTPGNGTINLSGLDITVGGALLIDAGTGTVTTSDLVTTSGNISVFGGTITTGLVDASGNIALGSSVRTAGQVTVIGNLDAGGNIDAWTDNISGNGISISGNVTAGNNIILDAQGSSGASPEINIAGGLVSAGNSITMTVNGNGSLGGVIQLGSGVREASFTGATLTTTTGNIDITVNGGQGVFVAGAISAGGNATMTMNGGQGHVHIGDYAGGVLAPAAITGGGNITATITGTDAVLDAGNLVAGSSIGINVNGNLTTNGGRIDIGSISGGSINLDASNSVSGGFANITINGNATTTIGNFFVDAFGLNAGTLTLNGDINANGNFSHGTNLTGINFGTGSHLVSAGNDIVLNGIGLTGSANLVDWNADNNINMQTSLLRADSMTAGGSIQVLAVENGTHSIGNVTAGHINLHFMGSDTSNTVNATLGSLHATGTGVGARDVVVSIDAVVGPSNGALNIASATADNGDVALSVLAGNTSAAGSLTVGGISAGQFVSLYAPGAITTGAMTVNNTIGMGFVDVDAAGNILINGGITVAGQANSGNATGAYIKLHTSSGNITVNGAIDVDAAAAIFTTPGGSVATGSNHFTVNSSGMLGRAQVEVQTFGTATLGNIAVDAVGDALVDISAQNATVGDVTVNVADGNFQRDWVFTLCNSVSCSIARSETMTSGGNADVRFNSNSIPGGSLDFGTVNITAGSAHFDANAFLNISGGGITINASGNDFEIASSGTLGGSAINFQETHNGGGATVNLMSGNSGGAIVLSGAVDLSAPGNATFRALADTISLQGIGATATAGTFTRSGEPIFDDNNGPFGDDGNGGGPRIDEGTFIGGGATVSLGGFSPSFGSQNADVVTISGNVNLSGAGQAAFNIRGDAVTVTGSTVLTSTTMTRNGTYADSFTDSASDFIQESGTVSGTWGNVDLDVSGSGDMQFGNITLSGPMVGGHVEGVNVTVGAVSVTATGGTLSVQETSSVNSASTKEFSFSGPNLVTGIGLRADNALNITGDITLNAVGAGGMLLFGTTIATQNITFNVTNGNYTVTDARFFSAPATSFTVGDAVLGFSGATATVNGNLSLTAAGNVNYGGVANVAGNFVVNANGSLTPVVSNQVQFLNALDSEDSDAAIVLPGAFNIQATNITLTATTGSLDIRNTQLNASQAMSLTAGTNLLMEAAALNAGAMELDVGGAVDDGDGLLASLVAVAPITTAITANSLTVVAGGAIDLDNTAMNIGSGAAPGVTGDADLLALLATNGIAPASTTPNAYFAGTNVSLGELTLGGDYLFVAAETFTLASFTGSNPDTLVQLTALSPTASIGIEDTVPNSSAVNFLNSDTFSQFAGMTIAVGDSQLAGNIHIGENGDIDVGNTNFFVVTDGVIIGMDKILSTGIIGNLGVLLENVFDVPQSDEIDIVQDTFGELSDDYALEEDEDDGEQEGEDTDDESGSEGDDDSLIRQDTVDEELVCS